MNCNMVKSIIGSVFVSTCIASYAADAETTIYEGKSIPGGFYIGMSRAEVTGTFFDYF